MRKYWPHAPTGDEREKMHKYLLYGSIKLELHNAHVQNTALRSTEISIYRRKREDGRS